MKRKPKDKPKPSAKGTIVKNGKRVPASTAGKNAKPPRSAAEVARDAEKKAKDAAKAKIAAAVWKATEASKTTIGKLAALVDQWDEGDTLAESLKDDIGGLKGQISEAKAEIRRLARETNAGKTEDTEKDLKALAGLERDCERWEVKLEVLKERRHGAREAMKCAMADIRKIIKEGPGLFDAPTETTAGKSASSPASTAPPSTATTASPTTKPGPSPKAPQPSTPESGKKSEAAPAGFDMPKHGIPYEIACDGVKRGKPVVVVRSMSGTTVIVRNADDGHQMAQIDAANYTWTPVGKAPSASSDSTQTRAATSAASSAPAATETRASDTEADPLTKIPVAEILGDPEALAACEKHKIKTLHDAARVGKMNMVRQCGLATFHAEALIAACRRVRADQRDAEMATTS